MVLSLERRACDRGDGNHRRGDEQCQPLSVDERRPVRQKRAEDGHRQRRRPAGWC
jgi:hypothetical protein